MIQHTTGHVRFTKARLLPTVTGKVAAMENEFLRASSRIQIGCIRLIEGWQPPKSRVQLYWRKYNLKSFHYTRIAFHGVLRWALKLRHLENMNDQRGVGWTVKGMVGNTSLEFVWKACENLSLVPKKELGWQGTKKPEVSDGELVTELSLARLL